MTKSTTIKKKKKKSFLSQKKAMTNLDTTLKSRDSTLLAKDCVIKATFFVFFFFLVVIHGCESRTLEKAKCWRIECWVLSNCGAREDSRVPWTAWRSNQSIVMDINPEYSLKGLMLKLKLQYFGHLMQRANWLEKTDAGKDWRQGEKGVTEAEMAGWHFQLNEYEFEQTVGDSEGQGSLVCCSSRGYKESDMT